MFNKSSFRSALQARGRHLPLVGTCLRVQAGAYWACCLFPYPPSSLELLERQRHDDGILLVCFCLATSIFSYSYLNICQQISFKSLKMFYYNSIKISIEIIITAFLLTQGIFASTVDYGKLNQMVYICDPPKVG